MSQSVDFLIFARLADERQAILKELPCSRPLPSDHESLLACHLAELPVQLSDGTRGNYLVAVVSPNGLDDASAATVMHKALGRFSPRYALLVGVAGSVNEQAVPGDVLVSDEILDCELQSGPRPEVRCMVHRATTALLAVARKQLDGSWHAGIQVRRPRRGTPASHLGLIASVDKIVSAKEILANYGQSWPQLLGVELQAGGVASAAAAPPQPPGLLMIRGVSDFVDESKNTPDTPKWRNYACAAAAHVTVALLKSGPVAFASQIAESKNSRLLLRQLFDEVLHTKREFDAFLIDNYYEHYQRLEALEDRIAKVNLLFQLEPDVASIQAKLRSYSQRSEVSLQRNAEPPSGKTAASPRASLPARLQPPGAAYDRSWYIHRHKEELIAQNALEHAGVPIVLWGPAQYGKTYLLKYLLETARLTDEEQNKRSQAVEVNLATFGQPAMASLDDFLQELATRICGTLELPLDGVTRAWSRPGSAAQRMQWYMERLVLPQIEGRLFLSIEQTDALLPYEFRDEFFGLLRAWAQSAADMAMWTRVRLFLAVSTTPMLLLKGADRSPLFNVAEQVEIDDFDLNQVKRVAQQYQQHWNDAEFGRLVELIGGHPYLVRLAFYWAALHALSPAALLDEIQREEGPVQDRLARWWRDLPHELLDAIRPLTSHGALPLPRYLSERLHKAGLIIREPATGGYRLRCALYRSYFARVLKDL